MKTQRSRHILFWSVLVVLLAACGEQHPGAPAAGTPVTDASSSSATVPQSDTAPSTAPPSTVALKIDSLHAGAGPAIAAGQTAVVQYTGWLYEEAAPDKKGKQFDSSRNGGQPFRFPVGGGQVIKGWDQGVLGMRVGESRRLIIPADLGYGDAGAGGVIPPGATLIFDVDLVAIE